MKMITTLSHKAVAALEIHDLEAVSGGTSAAPASGDPALDAGITLVTPEIDAILRGQGDNKVGR